MGITIFKFVIWVGILSDICSEIMFYSSANASPLNKISDRISDDNTSPEDKFEYGYPLSLAFSDVLSFICSPTLKNWGVYWFRLVRMCVCMYICMYGASRYYLETLCMDSS